MRISTLPVLFLSLLIAGCLQNPSDPIPKPENPTDPIPKPDIPMYKIDSMYLDTNRFFGDYAPIKPGNWWKYSIGGWYSVTSTEPYGTTTFGGEYSFTILHVDTPNVSVRFEGVFIEKFEGFFHPTSTIDTVFVDTVFTIVDSANYVEGLSSRKYTFWPFHGTHYANRNWNEANNSFQISMDTLSHQIQYVGRGIRSGETEIYMEGVGLIKRTSQSSARYSAGASETILMDKKINQ